MKTIKEGQTITFKRIGYIHKARVFSIRYIKNKNDKWGKPNRKSENDIKTYMIEERELGIVSTGWITVTDKDIITNNNN